jgi:hypothetical protein
MEHSMALTRNRSGRVVIEDNAQKFLTFQSSAPQGRSCKGANVRFWHKADIALFDALSLVRGTAHESAPFS